NRIRIHAGHHNEKPNACFEFTEGWAAFAASSGRNENSVPQLRSGSLLTNRGIGGRGPSAARHPGVAGRKGHRGDAALSFGPRSAGGAAAPKSHAAVSLRRRDRCVVPSHAVE